MAPTEFSSYPTLAYSSILQLDYYGHYVNLNFKRVAPEYLALAHNGIMSDNKVSEISDRIRLLDNKLFLNLKYSLQRDNLLKGMKQFTSEGRTTNIGINLLPGPGFPSANISMKVFNRSNNAARVDTLVQQIADVGIQNTFVYSYHDPRLNSQSRFQMINISQPSVFLGKKMNFNVSYLLSDRRDLVPNRPPDYNDIRMDMESFTFTAVTHWNKRFIQTLSHSRTRNSTAGKNQYNYNISGLKLDRKFFKDKISNSINLKYTRAFGLINFYQYTISSDLRVILFGNNLQFSLLFNKITQGENVTDTFKFFTKYSYSF